MIILTGGAGFIGSVFLSYLNNAGYSDIIVVDNLRSSDKWKNLCGKTFSDYWPREKLLEEIRAQRLPKKIESIIHFGACSSTLEKNVDYLIENNYRYSVELAQYCNANNKRFIYASSGATYGDGKQGFSDKTELNSLRPLNPYGYSKHLFDLWAQANKILTKAVGVKFFNVYGPNEYHKGPMQSMILKGFEQINNNKKINLFRSNSADYSDGGQMRDFIYVKDCCKVILWFLQNPDVSGIFNVGGGKARTWNDLANAIFSSSKITPNIEYIDMPADLSRQYQNFTEADIRKLRECGYNEEFTSLEDAVKDYVTGYLLQGHALL